MSNPWPILWRFTILAIALWAALYLALGGMLAVAEWWRPMR